jgi:hypothetical protein
MACLCTGGRASGRSGACVGRPWRAPPEQPGKCARSLRVASVVGLRLGRSRTWSTDAPPAAGGAPPPGCVHIARTRLRRHDRRVAGGGLGSPGGSTTGARRRRRTRGAAPVSRGPDYSSVHTASRVEPDGRDPSRVRARAGHAKSPPPRWRRALLAAPPRRRARSSLSQSSQAPACCRPTANARGASGATRRAPVRLARGSETRCQGRLRRRPVILGSCPGPWIQ